MFVSAAANRGWEWLTAILGGPARRRVVVLLACVLSLSAADSGTLGALAAQLEKSFRIGNTQLGLLATSSSLVGAAATLPMGVLADRSNRVRVLVIAIVLWAAAMVMTGLALSYLMLLATRLALGVVLGAAGPMVASLTGDYFPALERSRIYGFMLTGELLGAGGGLLVAGDLGAALGWRAAFFVLAVPSLGLAWALARLLPEPARGGQSRLQPGAENLHPIGDDHPDDHPGADGVPARSEGDPGRPASTSGVRRRAREQTDIEPDQHLVLTVDPSSMTAWQAARYVLRIRSNVVLIASSALGYFFLAGLRTFAVLFARGHFSLSQGVVSILLVVVGAGAVIGTLLGGRLCDRLIGRDRIDGRLLVAGGSLVATSVMFVPGIISTSLVISLPLLVVAAALLAAPNPALDAARLDVMPSRLWGRAEAVRTFTRNILEAFAPLLFGFVSEQLGGARANLGSGVNSSHARVTPQATHGIGLTFLIMLVPLAASGVVLLLSRRTYLHDVVTADASDRSDAERDHS